MEQKLITDKSTAGLNVSEQESKLELTRKFHDKSKKYNQERETERIDEENKRIFQRLMNIACFDAKTMVPNTVIAPKSLNAVKRKNDVKRIINDNKKMYETLKNVKPTIRQRELLQSYQNSRKHKFDY